MNSAKIFTNGRSQAVRIPKQYRFKCKEVFVNSVGDGIILFPKNSAWKLFDKGLNEFSKDFMSKRDQPKTSDKRRKL